MNDADLNSVSSGTDPGLGSLPSTRWLVLGLVCLIYLLVSADRANLGIALPFITKEYGISHTGAGFLITLMFLFYTAAQIPAGFLCKKIGPGHLMGICLLLTALASFLISTSSSFLDVKIYRSLLGFFEAPVTICCVTIINYWFSTKEKGTAAGFLFASSKLGPVLCPPIAVLILHLFGWREVFRVFAVPVALLAIFWFFTLKNRPAASLGETAISAGGAIPPSPLDFPMSQAVTASATAPGSWVDRLMRRKRVQRIDNSAAVFRSWNIIGISLAYLCMVGILNVLLAWMPSYLLTAKHLSLTNIGLLSAAPFAGAVGGNIAGGWISDRLLNSRRKPLMMIGALLTAFMFLMMVYAPDTVFFIGGLLLALGVLFGLGYPAFAVYPMGITTRDVYPLAFSVVNTAASLGAATFPLVTGFILDHSHWETVFYFLSLSSILCFIFLATIDEPIPN